jgi:hypothetical protein
MGSALHRLRRLPGLPRPSRLRRLRRLAEQGMTTAEYAIGTLAACGFAALLVTILRGSAVRALLLGVITKALALGG